MPMQQSGWQVLVNKHIFQATNRIFAVEAAAFREFSNHDDQE